MINTVIAFREDSDLFGRDLGFRSAFTTDEFDGNFSFQDTPMCYNDRMSYQLRTIKGNLLASGEMALTLWELIRETTRDNRITKYELWEIHKDRPAGVIERL